MKLKINKAKILAALTAFMMSCLAVSAQDSTAVTQDSAASTDDAPVKIKPAKNTFQSVWIIDNQTVLVPIKGTFEMDIQHRFGTVEKGYGDFWGFFAPSNIRLGFSYVPINKLNLGLGVTKTTAAVIAHQSPSSVSGPLWDASLKYSIITQTKRKYPVSISYYVNAAYNTKKDPNHEVYRFKSDRLSYFHQLLIARKITDKLSLQVAPSLSHQNVVNGYFEKLNDSTLEIKPDMNFEHFAIAFSARYKLTTVISVMINYDQPLTKHATNNPCPSLSFGVEFNTSSHSFQLFVTNYSYLNQQINNLYNRNSPFGYTDEQGNKIKGGKFVIGFNITRLWNY